MQKTLILGLGAFGFAIAKHLGENNPKSIFYASEINSEIFSCIEKNRSHPYFFPGAKLPENIRLISNSKEILPEIDIIISIIPCQFVWGAFQEMKVFLKDNVTILNLSKWIDNRSLQTVSEKLSEVLQDKNYTYAYLAGGMIAAELVKNKILWADIATKDHQIWERLKRLFISPSLDINLKVWSPKNTELYAALKNIIALILWYYEWKWFGASSRWYILSILIKEMQWVITSLWGDSEIIFTDYALSWDLIATCFWESRNRLLGNMLWEWQNISQALEILKQQNKIAEWYETLKWVYTITEWKEWFTEINNFWSTYIKK